MFNKHEQQDEDEHEYSLMASLPDAFNSFRVKQTRFLKTDFFLFLWIFLANYKVSGYDFHYILE
jgi:hypothetical protein